MSDECPKPTVTYVSLTDNELCLLDGRCSPEVQTKVDLSVIRILLASTRPDLSPGQVSFLVQIKNEAETRGKLSFRLPSIDHCEVCGRRRAYHPYKRNGKYHSKGDDDLKSPKIFPGVELADRFITIKNTATLGCCHSCWGVMQPEVEKFLKDTKAEIDERVTGYPPKWKYYKLKECTECGWQGHEGEMGTSLTLIGGGTYPSSCPNCPAKNIPLGRTVIETRTGHALIPVKSESAV